MKTKLKFSVLIYSAFIILSLNSCFEKYYLYEDLPVVTTQVISDVTINSAKSGGNVVSQGSSEITERGICWSTEPSPTILDNTTIDGSGTGEFTSEMTSLSGNTTYYVRAWASNSTGTSYGEEREFITLNPATTTGTIKVFVRQNTSAGSYIGGAIVNLYLNESDRTNDNIYLTKITSLNDPIYEGALFDGLQPQKYYFNAFYTNSMGEWYGKGDAVCTAGSINTLHIVCTQ